MGGHMVCPDTPLLFAQVQDLRQVRRTREQRRNEVVRESGADCPYLAQLIHATGRRAHVLKYAVDRPVAGQVLGRTGTRAHRQLIDAPKLLALVLFALSPLTIERQKKKSSYNTGFPVLP
jgi:hypothetical protein